MYFGYDTNTSLAQLLEQVDEAAARQGLSIETWLRRRLKHEQSPNLVEPLDADAEILDLVTRHFRALGLSFEEQASLASALLHTAEHGTPTERVVGQTKRRYRFQRRASAVSIRIGAGQVSLSLPHAVTLASELNGGRRSLMATEKAA